MHQGNIFIEIAWIQPLILDSTTTILISIKHIFIQSLAEVIFKLKILSAYYAYHSNIIVLLPSLNTIL